MKTFQADVNHWSYVMLFALVAGIELPLSGVCAAAQPLERLKYNHPGLVVDLGVGLWAWPLPMDFDGDGDLDLVVNCPDKPYNGVYFFENASGDTAQNRCRCSSRAGASARACRTSRSATSTASRACFARHRVSRLPQDRPGARPASCRCRPISTRTRSAAICGATWTTTATADST